jgi:murein DD-endopeptidase MepM/ murein hydrolase activator NlpD
LHRSRAYLTILLTLALLLGCVSPAAGVTSSDLTKHQKAADSARTKAAAARALAKKLSKQTAKLDGIVEDLQKEADKLNPSISEATKRSDRLKADVADLNNLVKAKQTQIDETQATFELEQIYFAKRVVASYKQDSWFYMDMLLSSRDIGDFIARTEFVDRAIRSSNTIAERLVATKTGLERARTELERTTEAVNLKRREAVAVENKLRDLRAERQAKTDRQNSILRQKSALLSQSRNSAKRLAAIAAAEEAASARIAALLRGRGTGSGHHGSMSWPVPGFYRVTSPFGWRMHPVLHVRKFHSGIDIGRNGGQAILGAAIVAAGSGTVIWAGPYGGYGNVVMINHGNGVVSLYAHQMSGGIKVHNGQHVSRGQRIGTVGSSGMSTGPHLHFEIRVNGSPRNPRNYV